ncbi:MAG: OmpA family protein [Gemmatimonadaceae bacterium]|nr:OmpA family protein [Gemmatimonadaceae bacterium]
MISRLMGPRAAVACAAATMLSLAGCASVTMQPAGRLTPVRDRVTDEAIARDLAIFDSYDRRLSRVAPSPTGAERYAAARASEYVRVARDAYERNDRTSFVEDALAWAAADIETLERGGAEAALASVVPLPTAAQPVDPAAWTRAEGLRRGAATLAKPEEVALAEGQLLRAGHAFLAGPACVDEVAMTAALRLLDVAEKGGRSTPIIPPDRIPQPPVVQVTPSDSGKGGTPTTACTTPEVLAGVPSIVHFALDKSFLAPATRTVLDALAEKLAQNPGLRIVLAGHTDVRAPEPYNQALSERRVEAVRQYLRSKGLDDSRLTVKAFGETRVLTSGSKPMDHARNRRVAITYIRCDGTEAQPIEQLNDIQLEAARRKAAAMREKD